MRTAADCIPKVIFGDDVHKAADEVVKTRKEVEENRIELCLAEVFPKYERPEAVEGGGGRKGFFKMLNTGRGHTGFFRRIQYPAETPTRTVKLLDHPFLANRFFVTPPVQEISISSGKADFRRLFDYNIVWSDVKNPLGVTVHDAYVALVKQYVATSSVCRALSDLWSLTRLDWVPWEYWYDVRNDCPVTTVKTKADRVTCCSKANPE